MQYMKKIGNSPDDQTNSLYQTLTYLHMYVHRHIVGNLNIIPQPTYAYVYTCFINPL